MRHHNTRHHWKSNRHRWRFDFSFMCSLSYEVCSLSYETYIKWKLSCFSILRKGRGTQKLYVASQLWNVNRKMSSNLLISRGLRSVCVKRDQSDFRRVNQFPVRSACLRLKVFSDSPFFSSWNLTNLLVVAFGCPDITWNMRIKFEAL